MTIQKAVIKVTGSAKDYARVQSPDGKIITLTLSDKVKSFHNEGLEIGADYEIEYEDEMQEITFAKRVRPNVETKKPSYSDSKDDVILKQLAMKCASYNESNVEMIKAKSKELYHFLRGDW